MILNISGTGVDNTNEVRFWYLPWFFITGEDGEEYLFPRAYRLDHNYPNPFNPATTIRFALPKRSHLDHKVYDILGRDVATLVDREMEPGLHSVSLYAGPPSSGV